MTCLHLSLKILYMSEVSPGGRLTVGQSAAILQPPSLTTFHADTKMPSPPTDRWTADMSADTCAGASADISADISGDISADISADVYIYI